MKVTTCKPSGYGAVGVAVAGRLAGGDLHGLDLGLVGDLGGPGGQGLLLGHVVVGADLPGDDLGGLLTDGPNLLVAVVVVDDDLDVQGHGGGLAGEGGHADLSVDAGVGVPAVDLWGVAVAGVGSSQGWQEE